MYVWVCMECLWRSIAGSDTESWGEKGIVYVQFRSCVVNSNPFDVRTFCRVREAT